MGSSGGGDGPRPPLWPLLRARLDLVLLVAIGGAVGSLARWAVDDAIPRGEGSFAWSVLLVNATGSALLGALVVGLATRRPTSRRTRPLLGTGVLGGYTTFSAATLDLQQHLAGQRFAVAALTLGAGLLVPLLAAWCAMALAQALAPRPRPGPKPGPTPGPTPGPGR